jgi:hypothetical protein
MFLVDDGVFDRHGPCCLWSGLRKDDPIDPEKQLLLESTLEIKHQPGGCILAVLSSSPTTT